MNTRALVTLAVGENYSAIWREFCEPNWRRYAEKYHFDLICLSQLLDTSSQAQGRSPAWQKCLIPNFAQRYERVIWIDADVVINDRVAPDIAEGVPVEKVGAVPEHRYSHIEPQTSQELLERMREFWPHLRRRGDTVQEYYQDWGLPGDCDRAINTGVMVLSPRHHRPLLEHVYYTYQEKVGREWHMEMRPLSYELNRAGLVHWIDPRFNLMWLDQKLLYYPFLLKPRAGSIKRKIAKFTVLDIMRDCINAAFQRSFFFHLGGLQMEEMRLIDGTEGR